MKKEGQTLTTVVTQELKKEEHNSIIVYRVYTSTELLTVVNQKSRYEYFSRLLGLSSQ